MLISGLLLRARLVLQPWQVFSRCGLR